MKFASPASAVFFAAVVALVVILMIISRRRRIMAHGLGDPRLVEAMCRNLDGRARTVRASLMIIGTLFLVISLLRPQIGLRNEVRKSMGVDVVLAIDASRSMLAKDVEPSRFARAVLELERLISEFEGDRVGIVSFAGTSFTQCPLTTDRAAARVFLRAVKVDSLPVPGTAISDALTRSASLLESGTSPSRIVILLTDGEDTTGRGDDIVSTIKGKGITVFAIGIGKPEGEPIPQYSETGVLQGYRKDSKGNVVMTRLDAPFLRKLASETGGEYTNILEDPSGPSRVVARIAGMKKGELKTRVVTIYSDKFQFPLVAGLLLLMAESLVSERRRKGS